MENRQASEAQISANQTGSSRRTLGEDLRLFRQEKNLTLRRIADETHISLRHLENIEEGRYGELPGGMYNRAFLRTYCTYMGLEPDAFLERYEKETTPLSEKLARAKAREQQVPPASRNMPPVIAWTAMLLISVAGLYFSRGWISEVFSPYFSRPPATRLPGPQAEPPAREPKPAPAAQVQSGLAAEPGKQPPGEAADATRPEPAPGAIRLEFQGVSACWMSVAGDGKTMYSGIVRTGETPFFDAKEKFELVLGNAGGVTLKINGKSAKSLGKPGEVVRLLIDAQSIPDLLEKRL